MPTTPKKLTVKSNASRDVINAIRNSANVDYKSKVPILTPDADNIREIGQIICDSPDLINTFTDALFNRIGRVLITSRLFENPWSVLKDGILDLGEVVEEIFIDLVSAQEFDPEIAESELFKREIPNVKSAFHVMNFQKFYKTTTSRAQLQSAFLSLQSMEDFIERVIGRLVTSANYDEFLVMKYLLAKRLINGQMYLETIATTTTDSDLKAAVSKVRAVSNKMEFMNTKYNLAGVATHTPKEDQYIFINAEYEALIDVEVLAAAFNMSKAEYFGRRIPFDGFKDLDLDRLNALLGTEPGWVDLEQSDLNALEAVPIILVDREFFRIYDNLLQADSVYNAQGLNINHILHKWTTFSTSPFNNAAAFVQGTPSITSVTLSPASANALPGMTLNFSAAVVTANFADAAVVWSVGESDPATIDQSGNVTIDEDAEDEDTVTVTATSKFNSAKYGSATITVVVPE